MRSLADTPAALVENGIAHFGAFKTPVRAINLLDLDPLGLRGLTPRFWRNARLKEWQHFAIVTRTHFLGLAVVNAKMMGVSWCYAFSRETGEMVSHERKLPFRAPAVSRELWDARFAFDAPGYTVAVQNSLSHQRHVVTFDVSGKRNPPLRGRLEIREDPTEVQAIETCLPLGGPRVFYTHKVPCPVGGEFAIGGRTFALDPATDFAILDVHKAFYPVQTWWKWATFAGRDAKGKLLGVNLTHNVNPDDDAYNENAIWHGNRISLLSAARFTTPDDIMTPWKIATTDGRADLTFQPQGVRQELIDYKVIRSWYQAPLGTFSGTLKDDDGVTHVVKDLFGICEHHKVTW
jgi:hypothetical protein